MAFNFPNASVISYSKESRFLGENFNYANVKNLSVQGNILNLGNSSGVFENFLKISGIIASGSESGDNGNTYQEILLDNVSIGSGRVTNISFAEGDQDTVRRTSYTVNLEIFDSGNLNNLPNTGYYTGLKNSVLTGNLAFVENLTEDFSFDVSDDNSYSFTHNLSITHLGDDTTGSVQTAQRIASGFFNNEPSFGLLNNQYSGYYFKLKNSGEKYFNETYDIINHTFNFTKTYNLTSPNVYQNSGAKYGLDVAHEIRISEDGKVTIVENGTVKALNGAVGNAITGALYEINNNCLSRVRGIYSGSNGYVENSRYLFSPDSTFSASSLSGINSIATNKTFDVDVNSKQVTYSASFVNNPNYDISGFSSVNFSVSEGQEGKISVEESVNYNFNFNTGLNSSAFSIIKSKYAQLTGSKSPFANNLGKHYIVDAQYSSAFQNYLKTTQSSINVSNDERLSFDYSLSKIYDKSYSDAESIYTGFAKIDQSCSDQIGQKVHSIYDLENSTNSQILQVLQNHEISTRNVDLNVVLKRKPQYYIYENFENDYLTKSNLELLEVQAINKALEFVVDHTDVAVYDVFIDSVSYSLDSDLNLNYNMNVNFVTIK
jgi:hypothetical protein